MLPYVASVTFLCWKQVLGDLSKREWLLYFAEAVFAAFGGVLIGKGRYPAMEGCKDLSAVLRFAIPLPAIRAEFRDLVLEWEVV